MFPEAIVSAGILAMDVSVICEQRMNPGDPVQLQRGFNKGISGSVWLAKVKEITF